jgi:hypothetical protein
MHPGGSPEAVRDMQRAPGSSAAPHWVQGGAAGLSSGQGGQALFRVRWLDRPVPLPACPAPRSPVTIGSGLTGIAFNTKKALESKMQTLDELKRAKIVPEGWEWIPGNNTSPLVLGSHVKEKFNATNKLINLNYLSESTPAYDLMLNATTRLFDAAIHNKTKFNTAGNGTVSTAASGSGISTPSMLPPTSAPSAGADMTGAQSLLFNTLGVLPRLFTGEPIITPEAIEKLGSLGNIPLGNGVSLPLDKISDLTKLGSSLNQLAGTVKQETQGLNHLAGIAAQIQKLRDQTFDAARQAAATDGPAAGLAAAAKQAAAALGGTPAGSATVVNGVLKKSATVALPAAHPAVPAAAPAAGAFRPSVPKPTGPVALSRPAIPAPAVPRPGTVAPASFTSVPRPAVPKPTLPTGSVFAAGYRPSVPKPVAKPVAAPQARTIQYTRVGK